MARPHWWTLCPQRPLGLCLGSGQWTSFQELPAFELGWWKRQTLSLCPLACWYQLPTYVMTLTEQWKLIELPDGGKLCESWLTLVASRDALSAWNKTVSSARCPPPDSFVLIALVWLSIDWKKINSFVCGLILKMIMMNNDIGLGLYCAFLPQS